MTSTAQRRLVLWTVRILAGIVVVLGILQVLGVMDHLNLLVFFQMVLLAALTVIVPKGWLPPRDRRWHHASRAAAQRGRHYIQGAEITATESPAAEANHLHRPKRGF